MKSKEMVYEQLWPGVSATPEVLHRELLSDLDNLINIVANEPVYSLYPCVSAALLDIKAYVVSRTPQLAERGASDAPSAETATEIGFLYKYQEAGVQSERADGITLHCLTNLFDKMRSELELIAADTTLQDFRTVFSGKVVSTAIKWMGSNG